MFATSEKEESQSPLVLADIKPTIFLALLEFIYTNCCSLSTDIVSAAQWLDSTVSWRFNAACMYRATHPQVIDVLAASIEYGMDGLTKVRECVELSTFISECQCQFFHYLTP